LIAAFVLPDLKRLPVIVLAATVIHLAVDVLIPVIANGAALASAADPGRHVLALRRRGAGGVSGGHFDLCDDQTSALQALTLCAEKT
jgi:hypothetical protein